MMCSVIQKSANDMIKAVRTRSRVKVKEVEVIHLRHSLVEAAVVKKNKRALNQLSNKFKRLSKKSTMEKKSLLKSTGRASAKHVKELVVLMPLLSENAELVTDAV